MSPDILNPSDIIEHHSSYYEQVAAKNYEGQVLGYVTPWNSHGYDVAKTFGEKFSLISPVWLQIQPSNENDPSKPYLIGGSHDIDRNWVTDVKNKNTFVVPRILFDKVMPIELILILTNRCLMSLIHIIKSILNSVSFYGLMIII